MIIDPTRAARVLRIRTPQIVIDGRDGLAASSFEDNRIFVAPRLLNPQVLKDERILISLLGFAGCSHHELVRWIVAHEMGHQVQRRNLGSAALINAYPATVLSIKLRWYDGMPDDEYRELEREYRNTPFEREADAIARKYAHLVDIS